MQKYSYTKKKWSLARIYWNYPYKLCTHTQRVAIIISCLRARCESVSSLAKGCQLLANFACASVKSRCCPTQLAKKKKI